MFTNSKKWVIKQISCKDDLLKEPFNRKLAFETQKLDRVLLQPMLTKIYS